MRALIALIVVALIPIDAQAESNIERLVPPAILKKLRAPPVAPVVVVPPAPPVAQPPPPPPRKPVPAEPQRKKPPAKTVAKVKRPAAPATAAPKVRVVQLDAWALPWPCWLVRVHAAGKTRAQLEAQGRANGISLTSQQRRQAHECLSGKRS